MARPGRGLVTTWSGASGVPPPGRGVESRRRHVRGRREPLTGFDFTTRRLIGAGRGAALPAQTRFVGYLHHDSLESRSSQLSAISQTRRFRPVLKAEG
jgi:hypothetical protein